MPDIISRIKVEAQGADQAAREILKLRDAYKAAGEAARGMSATIGGVGSDPFTRATAAGGGATQGGGNTPVDVGMREERSRMHSEAVRQRESKNSAMGGFGPGAINQGTSVADAISSGRGASAVGGMASMAGSVLGGPAGIALASTAAIAMGVQKFADKSIARLQETFGSGNAQRLGMSAENYDIASLNYSRGGVPVGMVKSLFGALSQSGLSMNRGDVANANAEIGIESALGAASLYGVDPNTSAGLLGGLARSNVDISRTAGSRMYGVAKGSFGEADMGLFVQSLQGLVDSASSRGIDLTSGSVNAMAANMGALAKFGGMSSTGAASFAQQLQGRGVQAAGVGSSEDVIAFQAMRKKYGGSVTDTMLMMERNPNEVNTEVYKYLSEATGGNQDQLRIRLQKYLGAGTTMSQVEDFIQTQRGIAGRGTDAVANALGATDINLDDPGKHEKSLRDMQTLQREMFKEFYDGFKDISLEVARAFYGETPWKISGRGAFGAPGEVPKEDMTEEIQVGIGDVQKVVVGNVGSLVAIVDNIATTEGAGAARAALMDFQDPTHALRTASVYDARNNPVLREQFEEWSYMAGPKSSALWNRFISDPTEQIGTTGEFGKSLAMGMINNVNTTFGKKTGFLGLGPYENPAAQKAASEVALRHASTVANLPSDITIEALKKLLEGIILDYDKLGIKWTDGALTFNGVVAN